MGAGIILGFVCVCGGVELHTDGKVKALQGFKQRTFKQDKFPGGTYGRDDSAGSGNSNLVPRTERCTGTQGWQWLSAILEPYYVLSILLSTPHICNLI